jgi:hypothetical protein
MREFGPHQGLCWLLRIRSSANQCYQQAAELSAEMQDFQQSMELYETIGDWSLSSALTKYSVKEYWLRAAMCSMAMGVSGAGHVRIWADETRISSRLNG